MCWRLLTTWTRCVIQWTWALWGTRSTVIAIQHSTHSLTTLILSSATVCSTMSPTHICITTPSRCTGRYAAYHGFIYSMAGCITGQSRSGKSCHTHGMIIGVKSRGGTGTGDYPDPAGYYFKIWPDPDPGNLCGFLRLSTIWQSGHLSCDRLWCTTLWNYTWLIIAHSVLRGAGQMMICGGTV